MHYFKRNIGDYHKKAGRLSMLEHGAYTLLMDACYDREKFPTMEQALDWCWARSVDEIAAVKLVLDKFFCLDGELYTQKRIADEIDGYHQKSKTNKQIALDREAARRAERERIEHETCTNEHLTTNQEPLTTNQEPEDQNHCDQQAESREAALIIPYGEILDSFKARLPGFPQPRRPLDDDRKKAIRAIWVKNEKFGSSDFFDRYFKFVSESEFLGSWKGCGFDWLFKYKNFRKVLEGNYDGDSRDA